VLLFGDSGYMFLGAAIAQCFLDDAVQLHLVHLCSILILSR